ncbi:MAG: protein kinase [Chlamydiales bacterium]|nr:protein kinase [Chlamydiales bacterium]
MNNINLRASISDNSAATRLTEAQHGVESLGRETKRVTFHLFDPQSSNNKLVALAVRELSPNDATLPPSKISLGFIDRFFWKPISIETAPGEHKTILVNIQSAVKRLGVLGFTSQKVQEALNNDSLGDLLISAKLDKIKESAQEHGCTISSNLEENIKKALIYIQGDHRDMNGRIYDIEVSCCEGGKIELFIENKHVFDFDSGKWLREIPVAPLTAPTPPTVPQEASTVASTPSRSMNKKVSQKLSEILENLLFKTPDIEKSLKETIQDIEDNKDTWDIDFTKVCSPDLSLLYDCQKNKIQLNIKGQLVDYNTATITSYALSNKSKLSNNDIKKIYTYLNKREKRKNNHLFNRESHFVKRSSINGALKDIPRSMCITETGDVFILLNRVGQGDAKVGSGTYKVVKKAINLMTGEFVAASVLTPKQDYEIEALKHEIKAHKTLKDVKNVLQLITVNKYTGKVGRKQLLISTFCDKGDLQNDLKSGKLSNYERRRFMIGLAKGFAGIHEKGLVHNDIKPANIMLREFIIGMKRQGENIVPFKRTQALIGDLGLSRIEAECGVDTGVQGTPFYLPPEYLLSSERRYNKSCDVWSLGLIFWEMLVGTPPWSAANEQFDAVQRFNIFGFQSLTEREQLLVRIYHKVLEENPVLALDPAKNGFQITILSLGHIILHDITSMQQQQFPSEYQPICNIMKSMLAPDPRQRPTMQQVADQLERSHWPDIFMDSSIFDLILER